MLTQAAYDATFSGLTFTYASYENVSSEQTFETFVHNVRGDLLSHTDARGNTTSYTYNAHRQLLTATSPDTSTIVNTYDENGELASVTGRNGNVTSYTYNPTGKLLTTTLPATGVGTAVITHAYDSREWRQSTTDPFNAQNHLHL